MLDFLNKIGELIRTQNNRSTRCPMFVVERREKIGPIEDFHEFDVEEWVNYDDNDAVATPTRIERLNYLESCGLEYKHWRKHRYKYVWVFETACFTEKACVDYIDSFHPDKSYDYRIYVYSAWGNPEFKNIREFLIDKK